MKNFIANPDRVFTPAVRVTREYGYGSGDALHTTYCNTIRNHLTIKYFVSQDKCGPIRYLHAGDDTLLTHSAAFTPDVWSCIKSINELTTYKLSGCTYTRYSDYLSKDVIINDNTVEVARNWLRMQWRSHISFSKSIGAHNLQLMLSA